MDSFPQVVSRGKEPEPLTVPRRGIGTFVCGVAILVLFLGQLSCYRESEPFFNNDETRHLMTGKFFKDFFCDWPLTHIRDYAIEYYLQYPALGLLIWPPLFYIVEGIFMLLLGPAVWAGKLLVGIFAVLACGYLFRLVIWTHNTVTAACAVLIFGFAPLVFSFCRQIMLEVPTLAFCLMAIYHFLRYLETPRRRDLFLAGMASAFAALTRFDAVFLLPFFLFMLVLRRRLNLLARKEVLGAAFLAIAMTLPLHLFTAAEIGWGHLETMRVGNEIGSGFLALPNFFYYFSCLPQQIGWFVLIPACLGLVVAIVRPDRQKSLPYLGIIAATYLTFSLLGIVESRHAIYWVPAFGLFAAEGIKWVSVSLRREILTIPLAAVVIAATAFESARPAPYVRGYEPAARYVVSNTQRSPYCLIDSYLEGDFIYQISRHDPARRIWVLRGDKLFYEMLSDARSGYVEHAKSKEDILALIFDFDPEFIVVESPRVRQNSPKADLLRAVLQNHSERFRLETVFEIESDQRIYAGAKLLIYRNLLQNKERTHELNVNMIWLRRRLQAFVP